MIYALGSVRRGGVKFQQATQNGTQFKTLNRPFLEFSILYFQATVDFW
jgi:hypothetical protein